MAGITKLEIIKRIEAIRVLVAKGKLDPKVARLMINRLKAA